MFQLEIRLIPFFIPAQAEIKASRQIKNTSAIFCIKDPGSLDSRWLSPPSICEVPRPMAATSPTTVVRMVRTSINDDKTGFLDNTDLIVADLLL